MTVTTTKLQDFLGRWLTNATPGTSAAADFLGRKATSGDHDYLGRNLQFAAPADWVLDHAYTKGQYCSLADNAVLLCTTAGTSAGTIPADPGLANSVTDGTAVWLQISNPTLAPAWTLTHAYTAGPGVYVTLPGGQLLVCVHSGTTAGTAPAAPGLFNTVVDGTATWEQLPLP
jgi:hypothetical protein